jgi:hypothetical protein
MRTIGLLGLEFSCQIIQRIRGRSLVYHFSVEQILYDLHEFLFLQRHLARSIAFTRTVNLSPLGRRTPTAAYRFETDAPL